MTSHRRFAVPTPSFAFILAATLFAALWLAGGASRADALGQVVVRAVAWATIVALFLFGPRPAFTAIRPVAFLLGAVLLLVLAQLVPLPPGLWQALPGRGVVASAATLVGEAQPWRPWSIVPDATVNAAASLVVPAATLLVVASLREGERAWLPGALLCLVSAATLLGLLQFSGAAIDNPFINETSGVVSGNFANRNHFALFLAIGCLLAPVWAFHGRRRPGWRAPVALGLVLLFTLTILAGGSRAGLALGIVALVLGLVLVGGDIRRSLGRAPRWTFPAIVAGIVATVAIFVLISIASDRAVSIDRVLLIEGGEDMRARGLPTVLHMITTYFPAGSGFGGFDPIFRMHEPFALLKPTYFNHAHNDLLELLLDGGAPAGLLFAAAVVWWAGAGIRAWRGGSVTSRLGWSALLLIVAGSAFDYPARTPMMMAVIVVAATWLARPVRSERSALRANGDNL